MTLPAELAELIERLRRQGFNIGALEHSRIHHLIGQVGAAEAAELADLLEAVLCKDPLQCALFRREWRRLVDSAELDDDNGASGLLALHLDDATESEGSSASDLSKHPQGADAVDRPLLQGLERWLPLLPAHIVAIALLAAASLLDQTPEPAPDPTTTIENATPVDPTGSPVSDPPPSSNTQDGACPTPTSTEPAPRVWAWVPEPTPNPAWLLPSGLLLLGLLFMAVRRFWRGPPSWQLAPAARPGDERAPRRAAPLPSPRGDLLLGASARRALIWSIGRYLAETPDRALDQARTVAATAAAAGTPQLIHQRQTFPREVWLWLDQDSAGSGLQPRLHLELERALDQANLPVRTAHFHGLPDRLVWRDNGAPFGPDQQDGAAAQALVAVLTEGAGLIDAWHKPGHRPRVDRLLALLRPWPRLCLVDLGDGRLTRLAADWRIPVRSADGLADWLARLAGRHQVPVPPPDPSQIDLWAGAWLLYGGDDVDAVEAESLRRAMGLLPHPRHGAVLAERVARAAGDPNLARHLIARLADGQPRDDQGRIDGDGWLHRALDYWQRRLAEAGDALPADTGDAARDRLRIDQALLLLRRDPSAAADRLAEIGGRRNRRLIRAALAGLGPVDAEDGPVPGWSALPPKVRYRLGSLGLGAGGAGSISLRRPLLVQLALPLLAGLAVGTIGWSLYRIALPNPGGPFAADLFQAQVLDVAGTGLRWRGSPWLLTPLPRIGPLDRAYRWRWQPVANPQPLDAGAELLLGGTRAFPIRGCVANWPARALAIIDAPAGDPDARRLALRLLDNGSADRVLIADDWQARVDDLTQGVQVPGEQLLLFGSATFDVDALKGLTDHLAQMSGPLGELERTLSFHGARSVEKAWPQAEPRVIAGSPRVIGHPEMTSEDGIDWIQVCGGTFLMGSPGEEEQHLESRADRREGSAQSLANEQPQHPVVLGDFRITRRERTEPGGKDALPIVQQDWQQAEQTCKALDAKLPTEAQWEYAARAGRAERWSFGDQTRGLDDYATTGGEPRPSGKTRPNGLCLVDMHGNVAEWVADCWDATAYAGRAPLAIEPNNDPPDCDLRVVRGGSFRDTAEQLSSASRMHAPSDTKSDAIGLRCVRAGTNMP